MESPKQSPPMDRTPSGEDVAFLGRLAGGLAHEIKNPLSTIAINLALLQEDWERGAAVRNPDQPEPTPREARSLRRIGTLQREVERLEKIVDEFQRYARGTRVNRRPEDLARIIVRVVDFVGPELEQAGVRSHVDLPTSLPLVLVDEGPIEQALLNLITNARQAMPDGGELLIQMRRLGHHVELVITDTGIGMTEAQIEHCFDVYWSNKKGGTGLGLPTTKRIIEEHGGTISVLSELGRGTSFSITLPLVVELFQKSAAKESADLVVDMGSCDLADGQVDGDEAPENRAGENRS